MRLGRVRLFANGLHVVDAQHAKGALKFLKKACSRAALFYPPREVLAREVLSLYSGYYVTFTLSRSRVRTPLGVRRLCLFL